ncbi:MAG: 50S ribosomal protein L11 methyltransferase [Chloroflexi bacterium]|nr:50S ribosomal protein L11 methyltransferase [Chloroflexota bacterium]
MVCWIEVTVEADPETAEELTGVLRPLCPDGIVALQHMQPAEEGADADWAGAIPAGPVVLRGYLPAAGTADTQRRIEEAVWHLSRIAPAPISGPAFREVTEEDWANAWKQHYHAQRIGEHLIVVPSWEDFEGDSGDKIIRLDPGGAFGTGLHPTTRLALRLLEHAAVTGSHVLDAGAGSGILAIAAALLGADRVTAVDVSDVAVEVARQNVAANHLSDRIQVEVGSVAVGVRAGGGRFSVVVANIIARVLLELADDLVEALPPGGTLILSGIIDSAELEVLIGFAARGLDPVERLQEGEWRAIKFVRVP